MTLTSIPESPHPNDSIVAVSSAPGPAPRAMIRIDGPNAYALAAAVYKGEVVVPERGAPRFALPGSLHLSGVHSPLPARLYFFAAPRSYTGQDLVELHTIGSPPLVERLVADLLVAGARAARPGEFTMRAFLAGKKDLPQAEAVNAVIEAGNDADLRNALAQLAGGVSRPLDSLRNDLLNLLADVEAALDFADEEIEFVGRNETMHRLEIAIEHLDLVKKQLDNRAVAGRPVRVAIVGEPNAGKSSLFNALAGNRALVSPAPGTTRDYLCARYDAGEIPVELIDTVGWQNAADTIELQAQQLGAEQEARADAILWCDESGGFASEDDARLRATGAVVLKVRTKADLGNVLCEVHERCGNSPARNVFNNQPAEDSPGSGTPLTCSVISPDGLTQLRLAISEIVTSLARPVLAPSQSRCRHHVQVALDRLRESRSHAERNDPPELLALSLRSGLDAIGEMTGAVYTNDLLDRIFSRFCIGK